MYTAHPLDCRIHTWICKSKDTWLALLPEIWGIGVLHFHWTMTCDNEYFALWNKEKGKVLINDTKSIMEVTENLNYSNCSLSFISI